jgi:hypothetical protein
MQDVRDFWLTKGFWAITEHHGLQRSIITRVKEQQYAGGAILFVNNKFLDYHGASMTSTSYYLKSISLVVFKKS